MELNIKKLINSIDLSSDIKISDIPNMDLYMEQLTNFIDANLDGLKRNEDDKLLTKTMINSYTKDGILMPPKNGKKYTTYHVISLLLIYHLKQILSISDIQALFKPILNDIATSDDDTIPLEVIYSIFLKMKNIELTNHCDMCDNKIDLIKDELDKLDAPDFDKDIAEKFLTIVTLVAQAEANKRLAEKLIDTYFPKKNTTK